MTRLPDAKPALLFISPLKTIKLGGRAKKVEMKIATVGQVGYMTLSYDTMTIAKQARTDLLLAGNAHSVPSEALWRAIVESITPVSPEGL